MILTNFKYFLRMQKLKLKKFLKSQKCEPKNVPLLNFFHFYLITFNLIKISFKNRDGKK